MTKCPLNKHNDILGIPTYTIKFLDIGIGIHSFFI